MEVRGTCSLVLVDGERGGEESVSTLTSCSSYKVGTGRSEGADVEDLGMGRTGVSQAELKHSIRYLGRHHHPHTLITCSLR